MKKSNIPAIVVAAIFGIICLLSVWQCFYWPLVSPDASWAMLLVIPFPLAVFGFPCVIIIKTVVDDNAKNKVKPESKKEPVNEGKFHFNSGVAKLIVVALLIALFVTVVATRGFEGEGSVDTYSYVASKNSNVFHKPNCIYVNEIKEENLILFKTRQKAVSSGRHPCSKCNP